jgi:hypothetical protein
MKTILVDEVRCLYSPEEIRKAETDAEVILSLRDSKGSRIFSPMRARRIAEQKQWFGIIDEMKKEAQESGANRAKKEGADEGVRNQKKSGRGRGKDRKS